MSITTDFCYIFAIPKAGSVPVISFLNRANPFNRVCLFCISVRNKIYVIKIEMLGLVVLASSPKICEQLFMKKCEQSGICNLRK